MKTKSVRQTVKQQNLRNRKLKNEHFKEEENTLENRRSRRTSDAFS
jgi:hypothetical protein